MFTEWVESQLISDRLDGEFFRPAYIENERRLSAIAPCRRLADLVDPTAPITNGIRGPELANSDYRMLRLQDVDGLWIDSSRSLRVSKQQFDSNRRAWCVKGDLLLATGGYIGVVGKVIDAHRQTMGQHSARLRIPSEGDIDPDFLLIFLSSAAGAMLCQRYVSGGVQAGINLEDVREIRVPVFGKAIQKAIGNKVRRAERWRSLAKESLIKVKSTIESLCGDFLRFEPKNADHIKPFQLHSRLDPRYYSPEFACVDTLMKAFNGSVKPLAGLIESPFSGAAIPSTSFGQVGEPVLQIKDIQESFIDSSNCVRIAGREAELYERYTAKFNTLILGMSGTIGRTALIHEQESKFIVNQRVAALPVKDTTMAGFLWAYLNSEVGRRQLHRNCVGGVQDNISMADILATQVLCPSEEVITSISDAAIQHLKAFSESSKLIDEATNDVDNLIAGTIDHERVIVDGEALSFEHK